jgi:hypothetical protein
MEARATAAKPAMAKAKRNFSGDFDAILAGFAQQPAEEAHDLKERRKAPGAETAADCGATENSLRRLLKNISFPWPGKIYGFMGSFGRRPQDAYDELADETRPAPGIDPRLSDAPKAAKIDPPKSVKTEDEAIAEELGLSPDLGTIDLKRIRRDFAKRNHPDRFEPARRGSAERRMSIANMLIDELMRQSRSPN